MILLKCNNFIQGAYSIRDIYIQLCNSLVIELKANNNLGIIQFLDKYTITQLKRALSNISVNQYGCLSILDNSDSGKILRILEFGNNEIRATHVLSKTSNEITKLLTPERR